MNRVRVAKGSEAAFEQLRLSCDSLLDKVPGVVEFPILNNATEELRWLTYFKGLIAADTHPRDQMLSAIDAVRRRRADPTAKKLSAKSTMKLEDAGPNEIDPTSLADALAAIDRALSKASDNGRL